MSDKLPDEVQVSPGVRAARSFLRMLNHGYPHIPEDSWANLQARAVGRDAMLCPHRNKLIGEYNMVTGEVAEPEHGKERKA